MTISRMKKSEMTPSEMSSEMISEVISKSNEFDRRVLLLINCRAIKDKDWRNQDVKKRTKAFLKLWEKIQKGMTYTTSLISYVQLKEDRKRTQKKVLEAVKQGDINMFT